MKKPISQGLFLLFVLFVPTQQQTSYSDVFIRNIRKGSYNEAVIKKTYQEWFKQKDFVLECTESINTHSLSVPKRREKPHKIQTSLSLLQNRHCIFYWPNDPPKSFKKIAEFFWGLPKAGLFHRKKGSGAYHEARIELSRTNFTFDFSVDRNGQVWIHHEGQGTLSYKEAAKQLDEAIISYSRTQKRVSLILCLSQNTTELLFPCDATSHVSFPSVGSLG